MRSALIFSLLAALVSSTTKDYIVLLNDNVNLASHLASLTNTLSEMSSLSEFHIHHTYEHLKKGYAVRLSQSGVEALRESADVAMVEENAIYSIFGEQQNVPSWGLARISERKNHEHDTLYSYPESAGQGVNAYVIDTGVNVNHEEFEGRAQWGAVIPKGDQEEDGQGHGTHVAGTIAGKTFGVAKKANIIAVKVLKDDGSGNLFDVIKGIEWAAKHKASSGKPGVANMSLGGPKNAILDIFVKMAVQRGLQFAVAAGNSNEDACTFSPANVETVVSVGATNATDERAFFSNYGKCVSLFAPGFKITSAWKGSKNAQFVASGTSMASPHVCGVLALILGEKGDLKPQELKDAVVALATKGTLTNLDAESPNLLLFNGVGKSESVSADFFKHLRMTINHKANSKKTTQFF